MWAGAPVVIVDLYEWSIWPWIIANGVVAAWALVAHLQDRYRHRALWVSAGIAQAIIALHVLFGAIAQAQDEIEPGEPLLYGLAQTAVLGSAAGLVAYGVGLLVESQLL